MRKWKKIESIFFKLLPDCMIYESFNQTCPWDSISYQESTGWSTAPKKNMELFWEMKWAWEKPVRYLQQSYQNWYSNCKEMNIWCHWTRKWNLRLWPAESRGLGIGFPIISLLLNFIYPTLLLPIVLDNIEIRGVGLYTVSNDQLPILMYCLWNWHMT